MSAVGDQGSASSVSGSERVTRRAALWPVGLIEVQLVGSTNRCRHTPSQTPSNSLQKSIENVSLGALVRTRPGSTIAVQ
jgi:hypothetical protein